MATRSKGSRRETSPAARGRLHSPARPAASDSKRREFSWKDFKAEGRDGSAPVPEFETYAAHLEELLEDSGKFVLVKGSEVVGVYESEEAADAVAARRFGGEPVMIKRIAAADPVVSLGGTPV